MMKRTNIAPLYSTQRQLLESIDCNSQPKVEARYIIQVRRSSNPNSNFGREHLVYGLEQALREAVRAGNLSKRDVRVQQQYLLIYPTNSGKPTKSTEPKVIARITYSPTTGFVSVRCTCAKCTEARETWQVPLHSVLGTMVRGVTAFTDPMVDPKAARAKALDETARKYGLLI